MSQVRLTDGSGTQDSDPSQEEESGLSTGSQEREVPWPNDELTDGFSSYISFCVDSVMPSKTIVIFPNNKLLC